MASTTNANHSVGEELSPDAFLPDPPSEEWELNILLDDIAQGITEEDLKRLKSYCIGGPGKRTLSEMKDAIDLFTHFTTDSSSNQRQPHCTPIDAVSLTQKRPSEKGC